MDVSRPFAALSSGVDVDVLVALAGSTTPHSGRELARLAGRSNTGVRHVLDHLVDQGLVERADAGRAFLYTLNRDHLLAPAVAVMSGARAELVRRLREAIGAWGTPPVHASLFGSAARGDGDSASDIDVFLVRPAEVGADGEWRRQVEDLADSIHRWTGNQAGIVEIPEEGIPMLLRQGPPVIEEVNSDAVDLAGQPARRLLAGV